jgi:hypothetical protein
MAFCFAVIKTLTSSATKPELLAADTPAAIFSEATIPNIKVFINRYLFYALLAFYRLLQFSPKGNAKLLATERPDSKEQLFCVTNVCSFRPLDDDQVVVTFSS